MHMTNWGLIIPPYYNSNGGFRWIAVVNIWQINKYIAYVTIWFDLPGFRWSYAYKSYDWYKCATQYQLSRWPCNLRQYAHCGLSKLRQRYKYIINLGKIRYIMIDYPILLNL